MCTTHSDRTHLPLHPFSNPSPLIKPPTRLCFVLWPTTFNQKHLCNNGYETIWWSLVSSETGTQPRAVIPQSQNLSVVNSLEEKDEICSPSPFLSWLPIRPTLCGPGADDHHCCFSDCPALTEPKGRHFTALHTVLRYSHPFWSGQSSILILICMVRVHENCFLPSHKLPSGEMYLFCTLFNFMPSSLIQSVPSQVPTLLSRSPFPGIILSNRFFCEGFLGSCVLGEQDFLRIFHPARTPDHCNPLGCRSISRYLLSPLLSPSRSKLGHIHS